MDDQPRFFSASSSSSSSSNIRQAPIRQPTVMVHADCGGLLSPVYEVVYRRGEIHQNQTLGFCCDECDGTRIEAEHLLHMTESERLERFFPAGPTPSEPIDIRQESVRQGSHRWIRRISASSPPPLPQEYDSDDEHSSVGDPGDNITIYLGLTPR
jgi:hypothetical protein